MVTEDISRKIANKLGLKFKLVDDINRFQYQFVVDTIKEANNNVHLIYIGKFVKKKPRKQRSTNEYKTE